MRGVTFAIMVAVLVMLGCGCRTPEAVRSAHNPEAHLEQYQTFTVLTPASPFSTTKPQMLQQLAQTVTNTVTTLLEKKGYRPAPPLGADFAVYVRGKLIPSADVTELGYMPELGRLGWTKSYPFAYGYVLKDETTFRDNVLIVEIYDNRTRKMVWVGWTYLPDELPKDREGIELVDGLTRILSQFPAAQKKASSAGGT